MAKDYWRRRHDRLDPETQHVEIYRSLSQHDFWWDMLQSLSLALFRTYAVPSIGELLDATAEFTDRRQQRYDDTVLLLEAPLLHGFDSVEGRAAVRRINQMHRAYDISDDDMRYVLSTFVVVPKRWIDAHGFRPLSDVELRASVNYYRALGRHLAIPGIPETYDEFASLMDAYEAEHFAFSPGSRRVADALVELATTFYPRVLARGVRVSVLAMLDAPLREALGYDDSGPLARGGVRAALAVRARVLRWTPSRRRPKLVQDLGRVRSYPDGFDLAALGTFPGAGGCPVPHGRRSAG